MGRCLDFPCCGHENGCCPDFDPDTGEQLNMVCVCGAKLPINNYSSCCASCLRDTEDHDGTDYFDDDGPDDFYSNGRHEAYDYPDDGIDE